MSVLRSVGSLFLDLIETIVIGLSLFLVVYLFFVQPHQVNGQSMVPNFQNGEYVLTDKISYKFNDPQRGDVIVFHAPEAAHCPTGTGCDFIKRIIAIPGETVSVHDNAIYVNNQKLDESTYIPSEYPIEAGLFTRGREVTLGANEYFALGDNRPYSSDSRAWGPVPRSAIVGKAFFKYWPSGVIGPVKHAEYNGTFTAVE
ncbi:MAG: signal peptidase I [Pseudomonadales bacterium]|nr:signal peptidase I [Candidatus Woesebacteria bacterium]MCB9802114.1 signal peptidase I [Pseudomonadales bacterium]